MNYYDIITSKGSNKIDELYSFMFINGTIITWDYYVDHIKKIVYIQTCKFANEASFEIIIERHNVKVNLTNLNLTAATDLKKSVMDFLKYHNRKLTISELL